MRHILFTGRFLAGWRAPRDIVFLQHHCLINEMLSTRSNRNSFSYGWATCLVRFDLLVGRRLRRWRFVTSHGLQEVEVHSTMWLVFLGQYTDNWCQGSVRWIEAAVGWWGIVLWSKTEGVGWVFTEVKVEDTLWFEEPLVTRGDMIAKYLEAHQGWLVYFLSVLQKRKGLTA